MTAWVMVVLAANSVDGGLVVSDVEDVLALRGVEFATCAKTKKPVPVTFEIDSDGGVANVSSRDACVRSGVERLVFPASAGAGSFVSWNFVPMPAREGGVDEETPRLEADALASFDAEVSRCYSDIGPTEKVEGSVSFDFTLLRSGAVLDVAFVEQSSRFEKTALAQCLQTKARHWRLPKPLAAQRVRAGWVFATSERRVRMLYIPSENRREIVAQARPSKEGGLDRAVIEKVIRSNQNEIKYCYESELQRIPGLAGMVTAAWKIGPDGSVAKVDITDNSSGNEALGKCIVERVRRWSFPPPEGGGFVSVTFPWIFKPAGVDEE